MDIKFPAVEVYKVVPVEVALKFSPNIKAKRNFLITRNEIIIV